MAAPDIYRILYGCRKCGYFSIFAAPGEGMKCRMRFPSWDYCGGSLERVPDHILAVGHLAGWEQALLEWRAGL